MEDLAAIKAALEFRLPAKILLEGDGETTRDDLIGGVRGNSKHGIDVAANILIVIDEDFVCSVAVEYIVHYLLDSDTKTDSMRQIFHYNTIDATPVVANDLSTKGLVNDRGQIGDMNNGMKIKCLESMHADTLAEVLKEFHISTEDVPVVAETFLLTIRPCRGKGHASNLFTLKSYHDERIDAVVDSIRQRHASNTPIKVLAIGRDLDHFVDMVVDNASKLVQRHYLQDFFVANEIQYPLGIQPNEVRKGRQTLTFAPVKQATFDTVRDACFLAHMSHENEHLILAKTATQSHDVEARLLNIPHAGERCFFVHLELGTRPPFRIGAGDTLKLNMGATGTNPFEEVKIKVIKYNQTHAIGNIVAILTCEWDKEKRQFQRLNENVSRAVIDTLLWDTVEATEVEVRNHSAIPGKISVVVNNKPYQQIRKALQSFEERLKGKRGEHIITANDLSDPVNVVDMYAGLAAADEKLATWEDRMQQIFLGNQTLALSMMRKAMLGVLLISGVAGTGKSFFVAHALQPFLSSGRLAGGRNQILVVANMHKPLNALTTTLNRITNETRGRSGRPPAIIVRLHSYDTEQAMLMSPSAAQRGSTLGDEPNIIQFEGKESHALSALTAAARIVYEEYAIATKQRVPHVNDPRLELPEDSLGMWALIRAGLATFPGRYADSFPKPERYAQLRATLSIFSRGGSDNLKVMNDLTKNLFADVLRNCDIVVTTISVALTPNAFLNFRPETLVIAESSRLSLAEHMAIQSAYATIKRQIMLGNPHGRSPSLLSTPENNGMYSVAAQSEFARMTDAGFDRVDFG